MLYFWAVLLVLLWSVTVWLGARLSWSKGRSQLLGGLIALVLPFIGLAIVWVLPSREPGRTLRGAAVAEHDRQEQVESLEQRDEEARRSERSRRRRRGSERQRR
jgi:hypothetical protein